MVISSLVVETTPDTTEAVAAALADFEGVEVHEIHEYKVVVTIEAETLDASHDIAASFISVPGVTNINLIYVNFEDDPTVNPGCDASEADDVNDAAPYIDGTATGVASPDADAVNAAMDVASPDGGAR